MKVNVLKMQFVDKRVSFSKFLVQDLEQSKRYHLLRKHKTEPPVSLTFITSRIKDKNLKHRNRPIEVTIWNKKGTN
jgi:hypothetical protein